MARWTVSVLSLSRLALISSCAAALLSGCTAGLRNQQLEQVAKDWALVIRASQVIPVYPLTEDLQPGDVLLTATPIEDQAASYTHKGFLPLDQLLVRLYSHDFQTFYNSRYGIVDATIPPAQWQLTDPAGKNHWSLAPRAAFPTYQFAVSSGSGLSLAIPVQGVPLALGLMHAGKASGTITIADAFTYGMDQVHLLSLVRPWADQHRTVLRQYAPQNGQARFLRVISRVYSTGQVSVTVNNDEAVSGEARGGADRPIDILGLTKGNSEKNYSDALETLNKLVSNELPGGTVKIAAASSRSVTLSETFPRPLVIGYVGFDLPILEGGRLGAPISTLAQLTGERTIPPHRTESPYRLAAFAHIYRALKDVKTPEADGIRHDLDALAQKLPATYPFSLYEFSGPGTLQKDTAVVAGTAVSRNGFQDVLDYLNLARTTAKTLASYLATAPRTTPTEQAHMASLEQERQAAVGASEQLAQTLASAPAFMRAVDVVLFDQP